MQAAVIDQGEWNKRGVSTRARTISKHGPRESSMLKGFSNFIQGQGKHASVW